MFEISVNKNRNFWFTCTLIFIITACLHLWAISGNHFHFTVDQGTDAVKVRDLLENSRLILKGPETSIRGVFTGPLWYYFISLGYLFANGNPIGPVILMIFLNVAVLFAVSYFLKDRVGIMKTLILISALSIQWHFFETGLWSFNPFPLVLLTFLFLIFQTKYIEKKPKYYVYSVVPVILSFNSDLAAAAVLLIFYILLGIWGVKKNILPIKQFMLWAGLLPGLGVLYVSYYFYKTYVTTLALGVAGNGLGVFSGLNVGTMTQTFMELLASIVFSQNFYIGLIFAAVIPYLYFEKSPKNKKTHTFIILSWILFVVSYLFFITNKGYRSWHTVYLPPVMFVAYLLMIFQLSKKVQIFFLLVVVGTTIFNFQSRLLQYRNSKDDASILSNQIKTLDWIYTHNDHDGFNVYNYTDTFYDYPYQYLFYWYGKEKYGFVPCEYSNYPNSQKQTYIENYLRFSEPKLGCNRFSFLIIQSDTNGQENSYWLDTYRNQTNLLEKTNIGDIQIEKRSVK